MYPCPPRMDKIRHTKNPSVFLSRTHNFLSFRVIIKQFPKFLSDYSNFIITSTPKTSKTASKKPPPASKYLPEGAYKELLF